MGKAGGERREYQWDERNRLIWSSDGRYRVEYRYWADGERGGKHSTAVAGGSEGETVYYGKLWTWRYDGLANDRMGRNSKHIYMGDTRVVTKTGRADGSFTDEERVKQYWYHGDHLGSAQMITDYEGKGYERVEYTPYGELWIEEAGEASQVDIPYRFTGKELDKETGLYYYGARYLDPRASRWISGDPALGDYLPSAPGSEGAQEGAPSRSVNAMKVAYARRPITVAAPSKGRRLGLTKQHNRRMRRGAEKRNGNLPGMGGVYNLINLHAYHYAGNNPVKYTDPDGEIINDITSRATQNSPGVAQLPLGNNRTKNAFGRLGCFFTAIMNITNTILTGKFGDTGQNKSIADFSNNTGYFVLDPDSGFKENLSTAGVARLLKDSTGDQYSVVRYGKNTGDDPAVALKVYNESAAEYFAVADVGGHFVNVTGFNSESGIMFHDTFDRTRNSSGGNKAPNPQSYELADIKTIYVIKKLDGSCD
jgi:RHS repeat-associated protein